MAKRVTGIGGIFFKANDPTKLGEWYAKHLDLELEPDSPTSTFRWRQAEDPTRSGATVWGLFPRNTDYFGADDTQFMVNYRVDNLDALLASLRQEGVEILREAQDTPYGRFAAIKDPEGNGIELWEAPEDY
jgi:lactoylglutathione lyase